MAAFTVVYIQLTASQVGAKYLKRGLIVMSESLGELKAIIDNAPNGADEFFMHQGSVNYICSHDNGHEFVIDHEPPVKIPGLVEERGELYKGVPVP